MKKILLPIILLLLLTGCSKDSNVQLEDSKNISTSSASIESYDLTELTNSIPNLDYQKDDINFFIDGNTINFSYPVYLDKNRYYIPLNEIVKCLGAH